MFLMKMNWGEDSVTVEVVNKALINYRLSGQVIQLVVVKGVQFLYQLIPRPGPLPL